jgi:hypothetical protein
MKSLFFLISTLRLKAACATTLVLGSCAVQALSLDHARSSLTRTRIGTAPHEIHELLPLTREQAVDRLLDRLDVAPPLAAPPTFLREPTNEYLPRGGFIQESFIGETPLSWEGLLRRNHLSIRRPWILAAMRPQRDSAG